MQALLLVLVGLVLTILGGCLWVLTTARWPGTDIRVRPLARAAVGLIPIIGNGSVGIAYGFMTADPYVGSGNTTTGAIVGLGVFFGAFALEGAASLLVVWVVNLIRARSRVRSSKHSLSMYK